MTNSSKQIDRATLKTLEPLNRLNPILLDELAAKSIIDEIPAGRIICRHGEKDSRQIYLLSGQVEVATQGETKVKVLKSKSPLKTPIAEGSPRTATLKTKVDSTLLYIDADLLELLMSDEPELNATYEVTEINTDHGDDWMLTFLQSPAFLQLPTENIQKLLTHMKEIHVKKDQVVIKQGDNDDNYYVIKSGTCNVHRQPYKGSASVLLAVLPTGSGFGEEALISNGSRNATITMRENGSLMKLKKQDFLNLLINPLIPYFEHNETQTKLNEGCVVIDVRTEQQCKEKPVEGSVNIPLSMLRVKFDSLNTDREYLIVCNDGSQSAAAAFLMIQSGLKCSVLKGGLNGSKSNKQATSKIKPVATPEKTSTSAKAKEQVAAAKKQTEQLATQQKQIKAAREKAEQDIVKHKKELAESRARIAQKKQHTTPVDTKQVAQLKTKASQELAKAQAESKAIEQRQKETTKNILRAEEMMKQSATAAEQTRKQAEQEAALIKQRAIEEAENLRAEKATQELAKAQAEREAIEQRQQETNKAMLRAEEVMKQTAAAAEQSRKKAEQEAALIKQRAMEEAEYLRAEVVSARQKMEQDAIRLKEEEKIIKNSALKMKNEADEIRRAAMNDAQQVRSEIESTRALLNEKLQQTQDEEKRKQDVILAEAKKRADELAATKTQQATAEAEAIRQKAQQDAARLHNELEQTRKQIEAEAAQVITELKEQSKQAAIQAKAPIDPVKVQVIEEEVLVEIVAESVDYKSVSIPGMEAIEPIDDNAAKRKAQAIKAKLTQAQKNQTISKSANDSARSSDQVKVHKTNDKTILEGEDDLFIFKTPATTSKVDSVKTNRNSAVNQRKSSESVLTQISTTPQESVVVYQKQEYETAYKDNPFLYEEKPQASGMNYANQPSGNEPDFVISKNAQPFNKQAHMRKHQTTKSNTLAIAASFLMILAGAVFTLHATNTLKVQAIASLFNSGNDVIQPMATSIAKTKTIRKKVLRADTKVNVKKKVGNKMDDIMQGWKNVLTEAENPKKSQNNQ